MNLIRLCLFISTGILTSRFRILFTPLDAAPEKATKLVYAACTLHNMLSSVNDTVYNPPGYADVLLPGGNIIDGFWRQNNQLAGMAAAAPRRHTEAATDVRNRYKQWFSREGSMDWQDNHINRIN